MVKVCNNKRGIVRTCVCRSNSVQDVVDLSNQLAHRTIGRETNATGRSAPLQCLRFSGLPNPHLVGLHFGDEVFEGGQPAEPHHSLALLRGQPLDLGDGRARQHDLLAAQEVLELRVKGLLAAENGEKKNTVIENVSMQIWMCACKCRSIVNMHLHRLTMSVNRLFYKSLPKNTVKYLCLHGNVYKHPCEIQSDCGRYGIVAVAHLVMPFRLILANSMAKVMWS